MALRNEPVQARSTARLTSLLDAAAALVDELGFERLTTAMVAERAGASIGTVYRYFPDRITLLQALGARNLERVLVGLADEVRNPAHDSVTTALVRAFDHVVERFRTEPGFKGLRVGDVIDLRPPHPRPYKYVISDAVVDALVDRFGIADNPQLRFGFEAAIEVCEALAARAFDVDPQGDPALLQGLAGGRLFHTVARPQSPDLTCPDAAVDVSGL